MDERRPQHRTQCLHDASNHRWCHCGHCDARDDPLGETEAARGHHRPQAQEHAETEASNRPSHHRPQAQIETEAAILQLHYQTAAAILAARPRPQAQTETKARATPSNGSAAVAILAISQCKQFITCNQLTFVFVRTKNRQ